MPHPPAASWALKIAISRPCRPSAVATPRAIERAWPLCSGNVAVPWHLLLSSSDKYVLDPLPRHQFLRKRGCAAGVLSSSTCAETRWRHGSLRMCDPQAAASPPSAAALEASEVRVQRHSNAPALARSRADRRHVVVSRTAHAQPEQEINAPYYIFDRLGLAAARPRAQYAAGCSRSSQQQSRCVHAFARGVMLASPRARGRHGALPAADGGRRWLSVD